MARAFASASSERIVFALGNLGFVFGPGTIAAIVRFATNTGNFQMVVSIGAGGGTTSYELAIDSSMQVQLAMANSNTGAAGALVVGEWYLIASTKATGTVQPRMHVYRYSTDTWTHTNGATALANSGLPATSGAFGIRVWNTTLPMNGDIAVAGVWDVVLTDAQTESLPFDLPAWYQVQPRGLWLLDQAAVTMPVNDVSGGGANESSRTGTTVSVNSVPVWTPGGVANVA
jgi:hypothetical protein